MKAIEILQEIVDKGGIIGKCGSCYLTDEKLAGNYVVECSKNTYIEAVNRHWGSELVRKINEFAKVVQNSNHL